VVLMDIRMPDDGRLAATEAVRSRGGALEVVILTTFDAASTSCARCGQAPLVSC
jgi:DNA-binding NarL/FixJ family response regulator